jgi:hypothetical protein
VELADVVLKVARRVLLVGEQNHAAVRALEDHVPERNLLRIKISPNVGEFFAYTLCGIVVHNEFRKHFSAEIFQGIYQDNPLEYSAEKRYEESTLVMILDFFSPKNDNFDSEYVPTSELNIQNISLQENAIFSKKMGKNSDHGISPPV